jgi:hypothetical protein
MPARKNTRRTVPLNAISALFVMLVAIGLSASSTSVFATMPASGAVVHSLADPGQPASDPFSAIPSHVLQGMPPHIRYALADRSSRQPSQSVGHSARSATEGGACLVVDPSQNVGTGNNYLWGVSMVSETDGWTVGHYTTTISTGANAMIQRWDGAQWTLVPDPEFGAAPNSLQGVDVISANDVWAVGFVSATLPSPLASRYETLIEHWNGSTWSRVPSPNASNSDHFLISVDGNAPNDVYTAGYFVTGNTIEELIMHWDGTSWTIMTTPTVSSFSFLDDIEVVAPNDVWAVGTYLAAGFIAKTLTLHYNGSSWSVVNSPNAGTNSNVLNGVDSTSTNNVWAAGNYYNTTLNLYQTLIMHWNGSSWMIETSENGPGNNYLFDVAVADFSNGYAPHVAPQGVAVGASQEPGQFEPPVPLTVRKEADSTQWVFITLSAALGIGEKAGVSISPDKVVAAAFVAYFSGQYGQPDLEWTNGGSRQTLAGRYSDPCNAQTTPTPGGGTPTRTPTPAPPTPTLMPCTPSSYSDVPPGHTFYPFVTCLANRGIVSGYSDCTFRPGNDITRGQIAKVVANAAAFNDDVTGRQTYTDVPSTHTFWLWVERLTLRNVMGGYGCGGQGEPCDPQNRPYFRPQNNASRGQVSKIVSNAAQIADPVTGQFYADVPTTHTFYTEIMRLTSRGVMGGYGCGGQGEPCDPQNRPYFRPQNNVTRGQASKIVANTFFPGCAP